MLPKLSKGLTGKQRGLLWYLTRKKMIDSQEELSILIEKQKGFDFNDHTDYAFQYANEHGLSSHVVKIQGGKYHNKVYFTGDMQTCLYIQSMLKEVYCIESEISEVITRAMQIKYAFSQSGSLKRRRKK